MTQRVEVQCDKCSGRGWHTTSAWLPYGSGKGQGTFASICIPCERCGQIGTRSAKLVAELPSPRGTELTALAPEMAEVLLAAFDKHLLHSHDPLWGRIDALAAELREIGKV